MNTFLTAVRRRVSARAGRVRDEHEPTTARMVTPDAEHAVDRPQQRSLKALPPPLAMAVRLMYVGALLTALALIIDVATAGLQPAIVQQTFRQTNPGGQLSGSDLDIAVKAAVIALIIGATIRLLLWLWMAWKNGQARPWARIVGTVFGVINLGSLTYLDRETAGSKVITVLDVILGLIIIALLWHKNSATAYRRTAKRRA